MPGAKPIRPAEISDMFLPWTLNGGERIPPAGAITEVYLAIPMKSGGGGRGAV